MKGPLLATALLGLPAALWLLGSDVRDEEALSRAATVQVVAPADANPEVERLSHELTLVRQQLAHLAESSPDSAPVVSETAPAAAAPSIEAPALEPAPSEPAEVRVVWDGVVVSQPRDRAWADGMEDSLRTALAERSFLGSTVERVDCRSTLCRLEIDHADASSAEAFPMLVMASPALAAGGSVHRVTGDDGVERSVLYALREGFTLPSVE